MYIEIAYGSLTSNIKIYPVCLKPRPHKIVLLPAAEQRRYVAYELVIAPSLSPASLHICGE
jgi:hypothetical protein